MTDYGLVRSVRYKNNVSGRGNWGLGVIKLEVGYIGQWGGSAEMIPEFSFPGRPISSVRDEIANGFWEREDSHSLKLQSSPRLVLNIVNTQPQYSNDGLKIATYLSSFSLISTVSKSPKSMNTTKNILVHPQFRSIGIFPLT
ncbi:hypothetical protein Avbf_07400, partial [Armadillidium vulgare]